MHHLLKCPFILSLLFLMACQANDMDTNQEKDPEQYRPQFHFTPETSWMNDPNGMVFYEGEYHLFYQYYPDASVWGPMHWGHAVSKDLIKWEHLPIALYPDEHGLIFSGSAIIDWNNTSGFGDGVTPPMIAIYTYHNMVGERTAREDFQSQGIAYSLDKGRTWTKYANNPVIKNQGIRDFRDPKVFWHEETQKWIMILAAKDRIQIFNSSNLKDWAFASDFGKGTATNLGVWECPDLFPLKVEGTDQEKWVMIVSHGGGGPNGGSCTRYFIGDFDGKNFTSDYPIEQSNWLDYGKDNYAGVTWSDIPEEDGRRLFIGWMSNWEYATKVPTEKWRSAMTIARELTLKNVGVGLKLFAKPVEELAALRTKEIDIPAGDIQGSKHVANIDPTQLELMLSFDLNTSDARVFGIELKNNLGERIRVTYDKASELVILDRSKAGKMAFSKDFPGLHYLPLPKQSVDNVIYSLASSGIMNWQVLIDRSSIELFIDDGGAVMTDIFFPTENFSEVHLFALDGKAALISGKAFQLDGIQ